MTQLPDYYVSDGSGHGTATETAHSNGNERIRMPVPAPAPPPFPEPRRSFHNGVEHESPHADATRNVASQGMDGREDFGLPGESQEADGSDPVQRDHLVDVLAPRSSANDTTRPGARVRLGMPVPASAPPPYPGAQQAFQNRVDQRRERMDGHQGAEPPATYQEAPPKYQDGSDRQRRPYHFTQSQLPPSTNNPNQQRPARKPKPKPSQPPMAQGQPPPGVFFAGATDVVINGTPSFNYIEGDVCVVNTYTTTTTGGSRNGHGRTQGNMNMNVNVNVNTSTGPSRSGVPPTVPQVEINLGDGWPFGTKSTPPFARRPKVKVTTFPPSQSQHKCRPQPSSMGSNPTESRHTDGKDDDNAPPTHPDGADGRVENNPVAPYGGDRFGKGASRFKMDGANYRLVNGVPVECDPGTLTPL